MMNCHGCEKETLNPHEDINKNESMEGGWGGGHSPPAYTSRRHRLSRILIKMGGVYEVNSNNINRLSFL